MVFLFDKLKGFGMVEVFVIELLCDVIFYGFGWIGCLVVCEFIK